MSEVTELDLRLPEFRDPKLKLEDLEFDGSGQVVRKDRFEKAMSKISGMLRGVNDLNARSAWTCDQVIGAVDRLLKLNDLTRVISNAPPDAELYHPVKKYYIKNINAKSLQAARQKPDASLLVELETCNSNSEWADDAVWLEFVDSLQNIEVLKEVVKNELS